MSDTDKNTPEKSFLEQVRELIETDVRPALQGDGGDIELVGVEGGTVKVRLQGACSGCPHAKQTLKHGVERYLRERIPEVQEVQEVR